MDEDKIKFCLKSFRLWHGEDTRESILTTYMTGRLKISTCEAVKIFRWAVRNKLVTNHGGNIHIENLVPKERRVVLILQHFSVLHIALGLKRCGLCARLERHVAQRELHL